MSRFWDKFDRGLDRTWHFLVKVFFIFILVIVMMVMNVGIYYLPEDPQGTMGTIMFLWTVVTVSFGTLIIIIVRS